MPLHGARLAVVTVAWLYGGRRAGGVSSRDIAMDPFGECQAYGFKASLGGLFDTCSKHAKDDATQAEPLGLDFCPTGCSSFAKNSGETLCCNQGCCRCGGTSQAFDTTPADVERGNYKPAAFDAWGVCSGNGSIHGRRTSGASRGAWATASFQRCL